MGRKPGDVRFQERHLGGVAARRGAPFGDARQPGGGRTGGVSHASVRG
jgi:hypothetical protein